MSALIGRAENYIDANYDHSDPEQCDQRPYEWLPKGVTHIILSDHAYPVGCMSEGKKYDQVLHDLPKCIYPSKGYIGDIAVDNMVWIGEECPTQDGGQVHL